MTTKDTVFKLEGRYIHLEDLKGRYARGLVGPEHYVQIHERQGGPSEVLKISSLIRMYGEESPFDQIPRPQCPCPTRTLQKKQSTSHSLRNDGELSTENDLVKPQKKDKEENSRRGDGEQSQACIEQQEKKTIGSSSGKKLCYWATTDFEPSCKDFAYKISHYGYFLLEDLKLWYTKKYIHPKEYVQVHRLDRSHCIIMEIDRLMEIVDRKVPLRFILKPCECDKKAPDSSNKDGELSSIRAQESNGDEAGGMNGEDFIALWKSGMNLSVLSGKDAEKTRSQ